MSGPLLPYIKIPEIPLGPLPAPLNSIKPFGVLVATGVYVGALIALRHARQRHQDEVKMNAFILYVVGIGFIGGHVLDAIFYTPEKLAKDWTYLFQLWNGLSSYGGFIGAMSGALLFGYVKKERVLPLVDTVCSAFPVAWVFGRAGCASVHDHLGDETTSWLGVHAFHPDVKNPAVNGFLYRAGETHGRFDLGLIECLLTIPLAAAFLILWRTKPRRYGFFAGWMCVLYAPVRFVLDFFRIKAGDTHEADPRYWGLTPAQFACFGLVAVGFIVLRMSRQYPMPATWEQFHAEADAREEELKRAEEAAVEASSREMQERARRRKRAAQLVDDDELIGKPAVAKKKKKKKPAATSAAEPAEKPVSESTHKPAPEPEKQAPEDES